MGWAYRVAEAKKANVLYMDDINIFCTDLLSVHRTLELTDRYGLASGSKLNREKTQALVYGPWTVTEDIGLPLTVNETDIKILGVKFDRERGGTRNWPGVVGKVRQRLGYWRLRRRNGRKGFNHQGCGFTFAFINMLGFYASSKSACGPRARSVLFCVGSKWDRLKRSVMKKAKEKGVKESRTSTCF